MSVRVFGREDKREEFIKLQVVGKRTNRRLYSYLCIVRKQNATRFKKGKDNLKAIHDHVLQQRIKNIRHGRWSYCSSR